MSHRPVAPPVKASNTEGRRGTEEDAFPPPPNGKGRKSIVGGDTPIGDDSVEGGAVGTNDITYTTEEASSSPPSPRKYGGAGETYAVSEEVAEEDLAERGVDDTAAPMREAHGREYKLGDEGYDDPDAIPEGAALEEQLRRYATNNNADDGDFGDGSLPLVSYGEEGMTAVAMAADGTAHIQTTRRPEDDAVLAKGESDLQVIRRIMGQFDRLRAEVQLPVMDSILLEKYILDPVDELAEVSKTYFEERRKAAEQLCREMPLIAAAVAGTLEPNIEGTAGDPRRAQNGELTVEEFTRELDHVMGKPPMAITKRRAVGSLVKVLNLLTDHKQATLEVLEFVNRREKALEETMALAAANEAGDLHDVEAAVLIHRNLFEAQKASLGVVERIQSWRKGLCMPHPFIVASGENYILKMFKDCKMLSEHLIIQKMLPMQHLFTEFPLFSNVPSISRYVVEQEAARGTYTPMGAPPMDLALHRRLVAAEAYMHTEIELQLAMVKALLTMAGRSEFLPILNISPVCPLLKQQQKEQAEKLRKSEARVKPLRMCVPVGGSTVGASPPSVPYGANVDPNSSVGQSVLKFAKGIRIGSIDMRERYEQTLLAYFDVLKNPPCREAYDNHEKEHHRHGEAGKTFKAMRQKSNTVGGGGGARSTSKAGAASPLLQPRGGVAAANTTPPASPAASQRTNSVSFRATIPHPPRASTTGVADEELPSPTVRHQKPS